MFSQLSKFAINKAGRVTAKQKHPGCKKVQG